MAAYMNRREIYKVLKKHRSLAEKRAANLQQNRTAKALMGVMFGIVIIYLIGFSILLATSANSSKSITSIEMIMSVAPLILLVDFAVRFIAQQTPSQIVKPYVLLPISRFACIDTFIVTSLFNSSNLIWFIMLIPYCLMSVIFSFGIEITIGLLFFWLILVLANSQWYLIVRTLVIDSQFWWLLPIVFYISIATPIFIGHNHGFDHFLDTYSIIGTEIGNGNLLPYITAILLLIGLISINRKLQYSHIWKELSQNEVSKLHKVTKLSFLNNYGQIGEYLKLEIKTILRNKNPRKTFISATMIVIVFSFMIVMTDVYDSQFMTNFWCIYNFVIYGATMLVKIMCNEGNYIEALLVHKENILSLFKAKYLFYCIMLIFPFLLMLPTVIAGKWTILMLISYGIFTAGFQYFLLFQLAVYNKQTLPLNTKFISKTGVENNYFQVIAEMITFIIPISVISLLQSIFNDNTAYLIILIIGLIFIGTNKLWLRNIYNRMIKRKYENMEAFRSSR